MSRERDRVATGIDSSEDTNLALGSSFVDTIQRRRFENENAVQRRIARASDPSRSSRMAAEEGVPVRHGPHPRPVYMRSLPEKVKLKNRTLLQGQMLMEVEGSEALLSPTSNPRRPAELLPQLSHDRTSTQLRQILYGSREHASSLSLVQKRNTIASNKMLTYINCKDLGSFSEMFGDPANSSVTGSSNMEHDGVYNYEMQLDSISPQLLTLKNGQIATSDQSQLSSLPLNDSVWSSVSPMIGFANSIVQQPSSQKSLLSSQPPAIEGLKLQEVPAAFRRDPTAQRYPLAAPRPVENDANNLLSHVPAYRRHLTDAFSNQSTLLAKADEPFRFDDVNLAPLCGTQHAGSSYSGDYLEPDEYLGMDYDDLFDVAPAALNEVDDITSQELSIDDGRILNMDYTEMDVEISYTDIDLLFDFDAATALDTDPSRSLNIDDTELMDLTMG